MHQWFSQGRAIFSKQQLLFNGTQLKKIKKKKACVTPGGRIYPPSFQRREQTAQLSPSQPGVKVTKAAPVRSALGKAEPLHTRRGNNWC